jgi:hypothetical protein
MRKWGIFVSLFYACIVLGLLVPAAVVLGGDHTPFASAFFSDLAGVYRDWFTWISVAVVLSGQILLLFLSVDTSWKRLKPRMHIAVTCAVACLLLAGLTLAAFVSFDAAFPEKGLVDALFDTVGRTLALWAGLWILWAVLFYIYVRNSAAAVARAVSWLLKGSVLELLIAVPCHVIVRRRDECCAPILTSFGIVTGIAVMLLSFGPSVLLLYKKRLDAYSRRESA